MLLLRLAVIDLVFLKLVYSDESGLGLNFVILGNFRLFFVFEGLLKSICITFKLCELFAKLLFD